MLFNGVITEVTKSMTAKIITKRDPGLSVALRKTFITNPLPKVPDTKIMEYRINCDISSTLKGRRKENWYDIGGFCTPKM